MSIQRTFCVSFAICIAMLLPANAQPVADGEAYAQQPASEIARIGNDVLFPNMVEGLKHLPMLYPVQVLAPVPVERPAKINLIETELLFRDAQATYPKAVDSIKACREFGWKKRAVAANHYYQNGLRSYFGYPWALLEEHYKKNPAHFDSMVANEGKGLAAMSAHNVALDLFLKAFPPDTALLHRELIAAGQATIAIPTDPAALNNLWAQYVSVKAANDFFLAAFFKKKYNQPLPDKLMGLVDKAEYGIQAGDTAMMARWMTQKNLSGLQPNAGPLSTEDKIRVLLRWKLFSEQAQGFSDLMAEELNILDNLCVKYETALWHCRNHIIQPVVAKASVDTATARLAYAVYYATHEKNKKASGPNEFQDYVNSLVLAQQLSTIMGEINVLYKKYNVVLIDPELRQNWWVAPAKLLATADSLARQKQDSLSIVYRTYFLRDYPFLPRFNEVVLSVADLQLAQKDSIHTFEAIGTLYSGLIAAKDPATARIFVDRLAAIFKGNSKYAEAGKACQVWLKERGAR